MKRTDIGSRWGLLVVTGVASPHQFPNGKTGRKVHVTCDCGEKTVALATNLTSGNTQSCGCVRNEASGARLRTHGQGKSAEYRSYRHMLNRCYNTKVERYPLYGGRGITVADEWRGPGGFERFIAHVGPRPSAQHSIDRIETNGNYEPGNVRWASRVEQIGNRRTTLRMIYEGRDMPLSEAARLAGVQYTTARQRFLKTGRITS